MALGVERVILRFDETVPSVLAALSLYSSEARAARALPKLLAELREGLGEARVGRLALLDAWNLHERSELVSYTDAGSAAAGGATGAFAASAADAELLNVLEPTRLAESVPVDACEPLRLIVRLERDDWFAGASPRREIFSAQCNDHTICAERSALGTRLLGWFD